MILGSNFQYSRMKGARGVFVAEVKVSINWQDSLWLLTKDQGKIRVKRPIAIRSSSDTALVSVYS